MKNDNASKTVTVADLLNVVGGAKGEGEVRVDPEGIEINKQRGRDFGIETAPPKGPRPLPPLPPIGGFRGF
jgi:hypothetical protein